eukprot:3087261-Pyramimonas_sp.AAC.1
MLRGARQRSSPARHRPSFRQVRRLAERSGRELSSRANADLSCRDVPPYSCISFDFSAPQ